MSIEALTNAEERFNQLILSSPGPISARRKLALSVMPQIPVPDVSREAKVLPEVLHHPTISSELYRAIYIATVSTPRPKNRVTDAHVTEARAYVEALLDVDLSNVVVEIFPKELWDEQNSEGKLMKSGVSKHLIVLPELVDGDPTEILVHEFGHAGHTVAQRINGTYEFFFTLPTTAEFVAHFCQYSFLLNHRTKRDFVGALGQFVHATFALAVYAHDTLGNFDAFADSPPGRRLCHGWPIPLLTQFYEFSAQPGYYLAEVQRGVAQLLSITLVDEPEGMRSFTRIDRIDLPLEEKLKRAFPTLDLGHAMAAIDDRVQELLARYELKGV